MLAESILEPLHPDEDPRGFPEQGDYICCSSRGENVYFHFTAGVFLTNKQSALYSRNFQCNPRELIDLACAELVGGLNHDNPRMR